MVKNYLVAVDIGTQGTKTALIEKDGTIVKTAFSPSHFHEDETGKIEQEPGEIYRSVIETIRQVVEYAGVQKEKIGAIGVDGMMAGIIGLNGDGQAVTPYDSGLDKRCEQVIPKMQKMGGERVTAICGCPIIVAQGAKMYWWKEKHPQVYRKVCKFVPISSYICGRLADLPVKDAYIDYTHIHLTCLADIEKNRWSDELIKLYGFDKNKLPRIIKPWEAIGYLTGEAPG